LTCHSGLVATSCKRFSVLRTFKFYIEKNRHRNSNHQKRALWGITDDSSDSTWCITRGAQFLIKKSVRYKFSTSCSYKTLSLSITHLQKIFCKKLPVICKIKKTQVRKFYFLPSKSKLAHKNWFNNCSSSKIHTGSMKAISTSQPKPQEHTFTRWREITYDHWAHPSQRSHISPTWNFRLKLLRHKIMSAYNIAAICCNSHVQENELSSNRFTSIQNSWRNHSANYPLNVKLQPNATVKFDSHPSYHGICLDRSLSSRTHLHRRKIRHEWHSSSDWPVSVRELPSKL